MEKCEGCPPAGYPTDETRCAPCPLRALCLRCESAPRCASGLCATCLDGDAERAGEVPARARDNLTAEASGEIEWLSQELSRCRRALYRIIELGHHSHSDEAEEVRIAREAVRDTQFSDATKHDGKSREDGQ